MGNLLKCNFVAVFVDGHQSPTSYKGFAQLSRQSRGINNFPPLWVVSDLNHITQF